MDLIPQDSYVITSPLSGETAMRALAKKTAKVDPKRDRHADSAWPFEGEVKRGGFTIRRTRRASSLGSPVFEGFFRDGDYGDCAIAVTASVPKKERWFILGGLGFLLAWGAAGVFLAGWMALPAVIVFGLLYYVVWHQVSASIAATKQELMDVFQGVSAS